MVDETYRAKQALIKAAGFKRLHCFVCHEVYILEENKHDGTARECPVCHELIDCIPGDDFVTVGWYRRDK